jgi:glutaredoxin
VIDSRLAARPWNFMLTLFQHPLCPHSRYVRLMLGEYGIEARLVEERFWERREEFLLLNPTGEIPVLVADGQPAVPGAAIMITACCRPRSASASKCGGWRAGSTTNSTPKSAVHWCWSVSSSAI